MMTYTEFNTDTLEYMMGEYDKNPEAFLADEFKRTAFAKALRDFANIAMAFSQTSYHATTHGNTKACDRIFMDARNMEEGNKGFYTPGGSIENLAYYVEKVRATVEHDMRNNTVLISEKHRERHLLPEYRKGKVCYRETTWEKKDRERRHQVR